VALGQLVGDRLVYEPINSCILLPAWSTAEVVAVDDLAPTAPRSIPCSRRWSITTARNAVSARQASS
jgi:xanthine dehydrogenase iron-sulfur cluster and FAD-binding subunit A